jgi:hypothetical protein
MHCKGKWKLRSHNKSYCLIETGFSKRIEVGVSIYKVGGELSATGASEFALTIAYIRNIVVIRQITLTVQCVNILCVICKSYMPLNW